MNIEKIWNEWKDNREFSGVFSVRNQQGVIYEQCRGYRNRSENLPNTPETALAIASGTKLFTGLAVCKLIEEGKLSLDDQIGAILAYDLGKVNPQVTVFQLLTHTSGIGDYLDEEAPDSYESQQELLRKYPVYLWENLEYYLQMITPLPQKFAPGERFGYSNAGYIMLGLVIEAVSGRTFQQFVTDELIRPFQLQHTGFYRMDALPANTAVGYIKGNDDTIRSNIFHLPIIGGSDGGLFTCAKDLDSLWRALFNAEILKEPMLEAFLKQHVTRREQQYYGLGVYQSEHEGQTVYFAVGGDFGIDFFTAYFPERKITVSALGNTELNTFPLLKAMMAEK